MKSKKSKSVRLPAHVEPIRYKISLKPDLEAFTFEGQEVVFLNLGKAVREITLHCKELEIESARFGNNLSLNPSPQKGREREQWANKIKYNEKAETVTFKFDRILTKGRGELHLVFRGVLNDKMRGFYRSRYIHEGKEKHLATTQFESTDARRAFPCVDEPAAKAIFDVSLIVPGSATAISNTLPAAIREHESGYKIVEFDPTPKMSTYLLAFIVGDFEWIEAWAESFGVRASFSRPTSEEGGQGRPLQRYKTLVRVFTTPGKKHQAQFALQTAVKVLEFYNKYFDIAYPLPVLDLIAIPDFAAGAMENWGAVTYRESALLVDEEKSSAANKQWVALVIAHELAHQWFGNLVTMEWWTHLWLNEGFASYIEYLAIHHLFPKWDVWTQFAYNDLGVALKLDALRTTHPIEVEVHHPDEIAEIFDEVSYSKGSSVIRMLADYLGEKDFRDGLRYYLKKHSYANASTGHLWQAFERVSGKPVEKIMRNWTAKPGYPLISVKRKAESEKLEMEQSRFFSSPISKKQSKDKTVWQVPIKVASSKFKVQSLLQKQNTKIKIPTSDWIKVNPGETGFYRVSYPAAMLEALKKPIASKQLAPIDRLGIIRDAFALAEAGRHSAVEALDLAGSFNNEDDYNVWVELVSGLNLLNVMLFGQKGYEDFKKFNRVLLKNIGRRVGWKKAAGEPHTTGLLRSLVLHHLGYYGDVQTISQAQTLFRRPERISPDLRGVVYSLAALSGSEREFAKIKSLYLKETLHEEKNRLARALASFRKPKLLKAALQFALSKNVRPQDSPSLIASVWSNVYGQKIAWNFVKANWKKILKRYGEGGHMLPRMIKPAGLFISLADAKDVKKFFQRNPAPGIARTVTQVLERIESNAAWVKRDQGKILNWLKDQ